MSREPPTGAPEPRQMFGRRAYDRIAGAELEKRLRAEIAEESRRPGGGRRRGEGDVDREGNGSARDDASDGADREADRGRRARGDDQEDRDDEADEGDERDERDERNQDDRGEDRDDDADEDDGGGAERARSRPEDDDDRSEDDAEGHEPQDDSRESDHDRGEDAPGQRVAARGSALARRERRAGRQEREPRERRRDDRRSPSGGEDRRARGEGEGGSPHRDEEERDDDDEGRGQKERREGIRPAFLGVGIGLGVAVVLGVALAVVLYVVHHHRLKAEEARRQRELEAGPKVVVATVRKVDAVRELTLPADVRAFLQTTVYAKVSGYVRSMSVDKGDVVHQGDVIARLETPEADQQMAGAAADVVLKRRTLERYSTLRQKDFVSAQDYDTARSQYGVSVATLREDKAVHDYQLVRAPFDGTITARYTDPGALIPAGTGSTSGAMPLVDLAQINTLRITLFVQQDAAPFIQPGDAVTLTADEQPQLKIEAKVSRLSRALDPRSRAMLCEIWLKNDYKLYPGTFMHARLRLHTPSLPMIPTGAVMVRDGKTLVAQVKEEKIKLVPVELGIDDGRMVQVLSGLREGDQVGVDVPSELADGQKVQPIEPGRQGDKDGAKTGSGEKGSTGGDGEGKGGGSDEGRAGGAAEGNAGGGDKGPAGGNGEGKGGSEQGGAGGGPGAEAKGVDGKAEAKGGGQAGGDSGNASGTPNQPDNQGTRLEGAARRQGGANELGGGGAKPQQGKGGAKKEEKGRGETDRKKQQ